MKKQQIHVISNYFFPAKGGMEVTINEIFSRLVVKGFDVTIHTTTDLFFQKNVLMNDEVINGMRVRRYKRSIFGFFPRISLKKNDVVVLVDFNMTAPYILLLLQATILKLFNKKSYIVLLFPEGGFAHYWKIFPAFYAFVKELYHKTVGVFFLNYTIDATKVISPWEKDAIADYGVKKSKLVYIPPGLEKEAFEGISAAASKDAKMLVKKFSPYILQIGRIHHLKNYEAIISILPKLENTYFLIIGPIQEEEYKKTLEHLAKKLGVLSRVKFLGVRSVADKYYFLRNAKIMTLLSVFESFGIVLLEAMSQGTPVISSNKFAAPTVISNNRNGFCVNPKDRAQLLKKVNFILSKKNSKAIKEMRANNIFDAKGHTWDKTANTVNKVIQKFTISEK